MIGPRGDLEHAILRAVDECGQVHIRRGEVDSDTIYVSVLRDHDPYADSAAMLSRSAMSQSFLGLDGMLARQIHMLVDDITEAL